MNLFIEKCDDAIKRTQQIWNLALELEYNFLWGIWCVKELHEKFTEAKNTAFKIAIVVAAPFALLLAAANILINVIFTMAVWLAVPVLALVHLYKDHTRREELQKLADISVDTLDNEQQKNLAEKLNKAITAHAAKSKPSEDCKYYYSLTRWNDLLSQLGVIKLFAHTESDYNAGRDLGQELITAFKSTTAYSLGLFDTKKVSNNPFDEQIERVDPITSSMP